MEMQYELIKRGKMLFLILLGLLSISHWGANEVWGKEEKLMMVKQKYTSNHLDYVLETNLYGQIEDIVADGNDLFILHRYGLTRYNQITEYETGQLFFDHSYVNYIQLGESYLYIYSASKKYGEIGRLLIVDKATLTIKQDVPVEQNNWKMQSFRVTIDNRFYVTLYQEDSNEETRSYKLELWDYDSITQTFTTLSSYNLGSSLFSGTGRLLGVHNDRAYVDFELTIRTISMANLATPEEIDSYAYNGAQFNYLFAEQASIIQNQLYVIGEEEGTCSLGNCSYYYNLLGVDISQEVLSQINTDDARIRAGSFAVNEDFLFVGFGDSVKVYDTSQGQLNLVTQFNDIQSVSAVANGRLYEIINKQQIAFNEVDSQVHVYDIQNLDTPNLLSHYDASGECTQGITHGAGVFVSWCHKKIKLYDDRFQQPHLTSGEYLPYFEDVIYGNILAVLVENNLLFVLNRDYQAEQQHYFLSVVNISNLKYPQLLSRIELPEFGFNPFIYEDGLPFYLTNGRLYITNRIVDVTNPSQPIEIGSIAQTGDVIGIVIEDAIGYILQPNQLGIYDFSDVDAPTLVNTIQMNGATSFIKEGAYLYVSESVGLTIYDLAQPFTPQQITVYDVNGEDENGRFRDMTIKDNALYLVHFIPVCCDGLNEGDFLMLDVSDPTQPISPTLLFTDYDWSRSTIEVLPNRLIITSDYFGTSVFWQAFEPTHYNYLPYIH